jgi:hypothetical protein
MNIASLMARVTTKAIARNEAMLFMNANAERL